MAPNSKRGGALLALILSVLALRSAAGSSSSLAASGIEVPGVPGVDYPALPHIPPTDFDCNGRTSGYYADTTTRCQTFHICNEDRRTTFLCPNGTLFNQRFFVCDWWFNVDCRKAPALYALNDQLLTTTRAPFRPKPTGDLLTPPTDARGGRMATSRVPFEWPTPTPSFARFEKHEHVIGEPKPTYYNVRQGPQSPYRGGDSREEDPWYGTSTMRTTTLQHRKSPARYLDAGSYRRGVPAPFSDSPFRSEQAHEDLLRGYRSKDQEPSRPRESPAVSRDPLIPPREPYSPPREYPQQEKPRTSSYAPPPPPRDYLPPAVETPSANIFSAAHDLDRQIKGVTSSREDYPSSYKTTGRSTSSSSGLIPSTVTDVEPLIRQSIQNIFGNPVPLASTPFPLPDNWFVLAEDPETLNNILTSSKIYLLQRKRPEEEVPQGRKVPDAPKTTTYKPATTTTTRTTTTTTTRPPTTRAEPLIVTSKNSDLWINSINSFEVQHPKMENDFRPLEFKASALLSMSKGTELPSTQGPVYYKPSTQVPGQAPVQVPYAATTTKTATTQPTPKAIPQTPNAIYSPPIKPLPLATVKPAVPPPPPPAAAKPMPMPDMYFRPPPVNQQVAGSATVVSNYPQPAPIQQVPRPPTPAAAPSVQQYATHPPIKAVPAAKPYASSAPIKSATTVVQPTQTTLHSAPPPPPFTLTPLPIPLLSQSVYYPQYSGSTVIFPAPPPPPTTARTGSFISQANPAAISSSLIQPSVQIVSQTEPKVISPETAAPPALVPPESERFNIPFKASGLISSSLITTSPIIEQPIQGLGVQPPASATIRSVRAPSSEQTKHFKDGALVPALFPRNDRNDWQPVDRRRTDDRSTVSSFVRRTDALLE